MLATYCDGVMIEIYLVHVCVPTAIPARAVDDGQGL